MPITRLTVRCRRCNKTVDPILEASGPHIKASCGECGRFVSFLWKRDARVRDARKVLDSA